MFNKNDKKTEFKKTQEKRDKEFEERVIEVDRVCRTVKGGKRMRFRALVAVGDKNGKVGIGIGKAQEVMPAVQKAVTTAKNNMIQVPIVNDTIPHEIKLFYGGAKIILLPAKTGTSVIAGSSIRPIVELAGIKNILSKVLGSSNKINNAKATIIAFKNLRKSNNVENSYRLNKVTTVEKGKSNENKRAETNKKK